jgi:hypothetical protein
MVSFMRAWGSFCLAAQPFDHQDLSEPDEACDSLTQISIDIGEEGDDGGAVSRPCAISQRVCKISLYREIEDGLKILAVARRNLPCYQELLASDYKISNICSFASCLWLGGIPAACVSGALLAHSYLRGQVNEKMEMLSGPLAYANQTYQTFMHGYQQEVSKFTSVLNDEYRCVKKYDIYGGDEHLKEILRRCEMWSFELITHGPRGYQHHVLNRYRDLLNEGKYACQGADRAELIKAMEESLACLDSMDVKQAEYGQFIAQYADEKKSLESYYFSLQAEMEAAQAEGTWNPVLACFSVAALAASASYLLYLYARRKCSFNNLKNSTHRLEEGLEPEHVNRMINLSQKLGIPLNDCSIEELALQLEISKSNIQVEESLFLLFTYFQEHLLPIELCRLIGQKALNQG